MKIPSILASSLAPSQIFLAITLQSTKLKKSTKGKLESQKKSTQPLRPCLNLPISSVGLPWLLYWYFCSKVVTPSSYRLKFFKCTTCIYSSFLSQYPTFSSSSLMPSSTLTSYSFPSSFHNSTATLMTTMKYFWRTLPSSTTVPPSFAFSPSACWSSSFSLFYLTRDAYRTKLLGMAPGRWENIDSNIWSSTMQSGSHTSMPCL